MTDSDEKTNPWTLLSARVAFENAWIRVEDHRVLTPAGTPGEYGKVCFKSRAIAILPLDADDHVYLVGQYRYTLEAYSWELPMGGAALDEAPLAAAQRELSEETGLRAAHWEEILRVHTSNSVTDEAGFIFLATQLTAGTATPEPTEALQIRRLPFADALAWANDGRITDAMSVAGLLHHGLQRAQTR